MFKYLSEFTELAHHIITHYADKKEIAIDCTLGNGYDANYLATHFKKVYAFDIQEEACTNYEKNAPSNVYIINDSHDKLNTYVKEQVDIIIYNLGFLPGGDKSITTKPDSSIESIKMSLELISSGGLILISVYRGHTTGMEEWLLIKDFLSNLPKKLYGVMEHSVINRAETAPILYVIEKK